MFDSLDEIYADGNIISFADNLVKEKGHGELITELRLAITNDLLLFKLRCSPIFSFCHKLLIIITMM
jgi:hypothetical protein